jgi:hypothetical protein
MNWDKQGGAAFPIQHSNEPGAYEAETGMSLRDWFAGQALANPRTFPGDHSCAEDVAGWAYGIADAMIAERYK